MYQIAIQLVYVPSLKAHLPEAIVASTEAGELRSWKAKALSDNLESYGFDTEVNQVGALLALCSDLTVSTLEEKYNRPGRRRVNLSQLAEDQAISHLIKQYLGRKLTQLFDIIETCDYPILLEAQRNQRLSDAQLHLSADILTPLLTFEKTQMGVHYRLQLKHGNKVLPLTNRGAIIISDTPARIAIGSELFKVDNINANKIKPFLTKESIFVKKALIPTYFKKFVLDVAKKAEVEAIGFDLIKTDNIRSTELRLVHDYMRDQWMISLRYHYDRASFELTAGQQSKTLLEIDGEEIVMHQVQRSDKEGLYVQALQELGLAAADHSPLLYHQGADQHQTAQWVIQHRAAIEKLGITTPPITIDGHPIAMQSPQLSIRDSLDVDWFDIEGIVTIGDEEIPFVDLLPYIRDEQPLYPLADGTYFLIPSEWMASYSALSKLGTIDGDKVRIRKSQYTLIEGKEKADSYDTIGSSPTVAPFEGHPDLKATLRPYQKEGVTWLIGNYKQQLGACLADDMGLGKTLQTLALLNYAKDQVEREPTSADSRPSGQLSLFAQARVEELQPLRALIVLPASLVFNWYTEIRKFCPRMLVSQYVGADRHKKTKHLNQFDIVLTTYHTAVRDRSTLTGIEWEVIVLDESQVIKNRQSKTFKTLCSLPAKHRVTLSGTPIENSLSDLWSQMQFLNPGLLGSYADFEDLFYKPIHRDNDEEALQQLRQLVAPYLLRRRKEEVAKDLPPIDEQVVYVEMTEAQSSLYEQEKSAARNELLSLNTTARDHHFHVLTALLRLRQICNHPILIDPDYDGESAKLALIIDKLTTVRKAGHKILVFSSFTTYLDLVAQACQKAQINYVTLTGASTQEEREQAVRRFQQDDKTGVFLLSIKAGGTGLNLTAASYVFLLDPWWNPFVEEQAKARAHRIGQTQPVTVLKFISQDSIEEKILLLQARKKVLSAELIEDQNQIRLTRAELEALLA